MEVSRKLFTLIVWAGMLLSGCDEEMLLARKKAQPPQWEYFAICTATLDGKNFKEIVKDPKRSLTHARISSDHKWITFTRYNKFNSQSYAVAENGFEETEIMLCRADGSELQTLIPPQKGIISCNSYWTPDNKGIIYGTSENPEGKGQIYILDLATRKRTRVPTPKDLSPGDPYTNGELVVFPGRRPDRKGGFIIYIMNKDGTNCRRLSSVLQSQSKGENDPKISPDGTKVAFMRAGKKGFQGDVRLIITDIKTGRESDISIPGTNNWDAMPEWSSDNKLLVFWHTNRTDLLKSGIYTIRPDSSERRKIPLPMGYKFTIVSFFPGMGSGKDAKIIFSIRRFPAQIRRRMQILQKRRGL